MRAGKDQTGPRRRDVNRRNIQACKKKFYMSLFAPKKLTTHAAERERKRSGERQLCSSLHACGAEDHARKEGEGEAGQHHKAVGGTRTLHWPEGGSGLFQRRLHLDAQKRTLDRAC